MRVTWVIPTQPRKKLTAAKLMTGQQCSTRMDSTDLQDIPRFDDETPSCPDRTRCSEGNILCQGQLLGRP